MEVFKAFLLALWLLLVVVVHLPLLVVVCILRVVSLCSSIVYRWYIFLFLRSVWIISISWNALNCALFPNKWRWWHDIDEHVLLGAMPIAITNDGQRLADLGVSLVISFNEDWELPFTIDHHRHGMRFLQFPTQDHVGAPNPDFVIRGIIAVLEHIGVEHPFTNAQLERARASSTPNIEMREQRHVIVSPASNSKPISERRVYLHCKAGRGRSVMFTLCYAATRRKIELGGVLTECRCFFFLSFFFLGDTWNAAHLIEQRNWNLSSDMC